MLRDDVPKIFGLNRVDTSRTVYVVEGPLDSLLLDNAVAMAGADVAEHPELLGERRSVYLRQRATQQTDHRPDGEAYEVWSLTGYFPQRG